MDRSSRDDERDTVLRESRNDLILQNIFGFSIELVSNTVYAGDLVYIDNFFCVTKKATNGLYDECGTIAGEVVDSRHELVGKIHLNGHTQQA